MQMRPLGQSGIEGSVVSLGTWVMGGWMWGGADEADSIKTIHAALDAGINLIDTAPIYGFGLSEEVVGKALKDRRDKAVIATKCGLVANPTAGKPQFRCNAQGPDPNGLIDIRILLRPESIREEVELSLKRLGTDHIDLLQTHWQDPTTPIADTMDELLRLKDEGKIRAIGVSNATSSQIKEYTHLGPIDSDQERYSMLDREIEGDQLPYCQTNHIAMLAYSPLAQGLLTGKVGPNRSFREGDQRRGKPRFSVDSRQRIGRMLEQFQPVADRHKITLSQLVIAWTFHQPGLTHVLCGARTPDQVLENAKAGDVTLSDDELQRINEAICVYHEHPTSTA